MNLPTMSLDALERVVRGTAAETMSFIGEGLPLVVVDLDAASDPIGALHTGVPPIVVGTTARADPLEHPAALSCDVVLTADDAVLAVLAEAVRANPISATALAHLLRGSERRTVDEGLHAESAVYSVLQAGPEFARWRANRPPLPAADSNEDERVALVRTGDRLTITLTRPRVRNALDKAMRDALVDAFQLAAIDDSIADVHLRGEGPSFCAGGDLDEFGSLPDPATAHLIRVQQSVGRAVHAVAKRATAHLQGACFGSGIEIPAFAGTVLADPTTMIALPEISLGLIPGAGGTVSLPRRIGRHRTARLALTGEHLDAETALEWGLIDRITTAP